MTHRLWVAWAVWAAAAVAWGAEKPPSGPATAGRAFVQRGLASLEARAYDEAAAAFRKAIDADPGVEAEARLYLGRALMEQGKWDEAAAEIKRARDLKLPRDKDIEAQLDLLYIDSARQLERLEAGAPRPRRLTFRLEVAGDYQTDLALPREMVPPYRFLRANDFRLRLAADVGYRIPIDPGTLGLGYGFFQTLHAGHDEIDFQGHSLSALYWWEPIADVTTAVGLDATHYELDNDSLLNEYGAGASVYFPETDWLAGRIAYDLSMYDHRLNDDLDGPEQRVSVAQIIRLGDPRNYLSLGYAFAGHHPHARRLAFESHGPSVGAQWAFTDRDWLNVYAAYERAKYDAEDPTESKRRDDRVLSLSARVSHALTPWWTLYAQVGWSHSSSDLSRQDYDGMAASVGSIFRW